jgi:5-methylthioadenosine/S-adenosylhomocysteine deaminase
MIHFPCFSPPQAGGDSGFRESLSHNPHTITLVRSGVMVPAHDAPAIANGAVAVSGQTIADLGTFDELSARYPAAQVIGGDQFLLIPGLINGHGHGRGLSSFQRGALDNTLESWIWDTRKFKPLPIYDDVSYCAAKLLKSGVTTTMHNHILTGAFPPEREFDDAIMAYKDAGMRVLFCPGIRDDNPFVYGNNKGFFASLPKPMQATLSSPPPLSAEDYFGMVRALHERHHRSMCHVGFGPVGPQWCTTHLLLEIRRTAKELSMPVHIHSLESVLQKIHGLTALGRSHIRFMQDIGFLGPEVALSHSVWVTEDDIRLIAENGAGVTHQPSSNLRLRSGIAPVFQMLEAGVRVGLGLDGQGINDNDDFIQEMKLCYLLHRIPSLELDSPHLTARQVFKMATETNASLLGFGSQTGRLEPGRCADLVLLDFKKMCFPYTDPKHDPIDVLLYRGSGAHVHTVMVSGRVVVEAGKVLTIEEEAIAAHLAEAASRPRTENERKLVRAIDELKRHVIRYYGGWPKKVTKELYFRINSRIDSFL